MTRRGYGSRGFDNQQSTLRCSQYKSCLCQRLPQTKVWKLLTVTRHFHIIHTSINTFLQYMPPTCTHHNTITNPRSSTAANDNKIYTVSRKKRTPKYFAITVTNLHQIKQYFACTKWRRSFVRYCGRGSSLLWTPALRPLWRSNAPAQGEDGNW